MGRKKKEQNQNDEPLKIKYWQIRHNAYDRNEV